MGKHRNLLDPFLETRKFHFLALVVLSSTLLFGRLHQGDLSGFDDAIYAHEGRQILMTGDWWNIRFNGYLNFEYPPMFMWLEAISMSVLGATDFAAKFPAALLGLGTILLVYLITRALSDDAWLPILAMLVLVTTQYFMKYATHAMTDVPFTFFFTLAIFFYVKGLQQPRYFLLCGLPIALGILTRSVIGLLPLGAIAAHLMVSGRYRMLRSGYLIGGFFFGLAVPLIWYGSQYRWHGDQFLSSHFSFIMSKVAAQQPPSGWSRVYTYVRYPFLLLKFYWPWLPFMVAGLWMQAQALRSRKNTLASLLIVWVLLVVIPFSLPQTKVLRYIMPAFPAFSVLAAMALARWLSTVGKVRLLSVVYVAFCVFIVITVAFSMKLYRPRAEDMHALGPIAEKNTPPGEKVLLYTYGEPGWSYRNQFLWYGNRYCELVTDMGTLKQRLQSGANKVAIVDRASYVQLVNLGLVTKILGQSQNFVCFKI